MRSCFNRKLFFKNNFYTAKKLLRNFLQKDVRKLFSIIFKRLKSDQYNGMAERYKEQPVQQRMSAMLMTLFTVRKKLTILFKQCDYNI